MAVLISVTRGVPWRTDLRTKSIEPFSPHYPLHQNATQEAHRGVGRTHPTQTLSSLPLEIDPSIETESTGCLV
eukprot:3117873-Prymnesium_polylepis.1